MLLRRSALVLALAVISAGSVRPVLAQTAVTSTTRMATRAELERLQGSYEQLAASTAYSERTRAKARSQAEEVRRRLREGDFRVGDQILVRVDGGVSVNDTATVTEGQRIQVRGVRQIELAGVLRAELATKVTAEVREIVKEATVNVRALTRIAVFGAVQHPGYFAVPVETTVDQLITLAGGPTDAARPDRVRLMRGDEVILRGPEVQQAIAEGRTLDALDAREGDVLEVQRIDQGWQTQNTVQLITVLVSPIITFLLLR
jgi:hypothetical protein